MAGRSNGNRASGPSRVFAVVVWAIAGATIAADIDDMRAWMDLEGRVHVRWTTVAPSKGGIVWGSTPELLTNVVNEDASCLRGTTNNRDSGKGWANNHRADFAGPKRKPVFVQVRAVARPDGKLLSSVVRVRPPAAPGNRPAVKAVPISVDLGDWPFAVVPLTFGVPLPRGRLADSAHVRLAGDGKEFAIQVQVVTRWLSDQSVKWLRVDAVVPRDARRLRIEYGASVSPNPGRSPAPDVNREALPEIVRGLELTGTDGIVFHFQPQLPIWEEYGPVKRVLRVAGPLVAADGKRLFRVVLRRVTWPGQDWQRLDITLENDRTEEEMSSFRSFVLRTPHDGAPVTAGRGKMRVRLTPGQRLFQREDFQWVATSNTERPRKGRRIDGVFRLGEDRALLFRHFWENWPAAVTVERNAFVIGLCPALPPRFYTDRPDEDKLYFSIRDGVHTFRQGWSHTWTVWTVDGNEARSPGGLAGEMPVASVPAEWIEQSGAFGRLAVAVRDQFPGYDEALKRIIDAYPTTRERKREFGMMNFGDWYGERRWNWGNLEYDLGHAFLTQFMRTGYAPFRRRADEIIRHQRDVDTRHCARDPRRIGQQWLHSMGHTAGYYDNDYKHMKRYAGSGWSDNRGHVWAQGMFEAYLLGGETRSWITARLIADWAAGPQTTNFRFGNAREPGWMLKLVMSAYAATEDPFYLNAARLMIREVHRKSVETGGHGFYYHALPPGHCNCPKGSRHKGGAGFMLGILMTGMKMFHDVTGDETVAADIASTARFVVDSMWDPGADGFRYTSCPKTRASGSSTFILLEGLAFGARHLHDRSMADICRRGLTAAWTSLPGSGKSAGYVFCNSARGLEQVVRLPGPPFRDYLLRWTALLKSPARRDLPTLVPNPDFEETIRGWPTRGWQIERSTRVCHAGNASLHIFGTKAGQNEYVNTSYDTTGSPFEIRWLRPDADYELSAWVRVDRISPGASSPSLRLAFRDVQGTRSAIATKAYDLKQLGTWQRLSARVKVPEWNTRNYIALNTNTRKAADVDMYLDDVHLVPGSTSIPDFPVSVRLDPAHAELRAGARIGPNPRFRAAPAVSGPGSAAWRTAAPVAGQYWLWGRVDAGAEFARAGVDDRDLSTAVRVEKPGWVLLGSVQRPAGPCRVHVEGLARGPFLMRLILTNVPCEAVDR